ACALPIYAADLDLSGGVARHGGQQDAAQGVAQRVAVAAFEGLHHDLGVMRAQGLDGNGTGLQKTLCGHGCSFSIPSARYTDKADGMKDRRGNRNTNTAHLGLTAGAWAVLRIPGPKPGTEREGGRA